MSFYRPRADRRGSRQGCPGPQTGGEAVAALPQHLLACGHVHLRAAGTRHKAVASVRGLDRRSQGEAATETSCRNSDTVHSSCFARVLRLQPANATSLILEASSEMSDPLPHSHTRRLRSWGAGASRLARWRTHSSRLLSTSRHHRSLVGAMGPFQTAQALCRCLSSGRQQVEEMVRVRACMRARMMLHRRSTQSTHVTAKHQSQGKSERGDCVIVC